jgi:flagellar biosynthesis protein FliP
MKETKELEKAFIFGIGIALGFFVVDWLKKRWL